MGYEISCWMVVRPSTWTHLECDGKKWTITITWLTLSEWLAAFTGGKWTEFSYMSVTNSKREKIASACNVRLIFVLGDYWMTIDWPNWYRLRRRQRSTQRPQRRVFVKRSLIMSMIRTVWVIFISVYSNRNKNWPDLTWPALISSVTIQKTKECSCQTSAREAWTSNGREWKVGHFRQG